jgi:hypothetical protein
MTTLGYRSCIWSPHRVRRSSNRKRELKRELNEIDDGDTPVRGPDACPRGPGHGRVVRRPGADRGTTRRGQHGPADGPTGDGRRDGERRDPQESPAGRAGAVGPPRDQKRRGVRRGTHYHRDRTRGSRRSDPALSVLSSSVSSSVSRSTSPPSLVATTGEWFEISRQY